MFNEPVLLIRADASPEKGTGHVMRCFALAQTWIDHGGNVIFISALNSPMLEERLKSENIKIFRLSAIPGSHEDASQTTNIAYAYDVEWVVIDGYHFNADYQRKIIESGLHLLMFDDFGHADYYHADLILNQNLFADERNYKNREPHVRLLLGTKYIQLRREYKKWREWKRVIPEKAKNILVTFGGSDSEDVTIRVVKALSELNNTKINIYVVTGALYKNANKLNFITQSPNSNIKLLKNVENMSELMAWADVAISSGGTTAWELIFFGLPCLLYVLAQNQENVVKYLEMSGAAINLGKLKEMSKEHFLTIIKNVIQSSNIRNQMFISGRGLVDTDGGERLMMFMKNELLRGRKVLEDDRNLIWNWANDPKVRLWSLQSELIPWETHINWFNEKMKDPNCYMYIFINQSDIPIGQVRFQVISEEHATINISVAHEHRGKGYGKKSIELACQMLFDESYVNKIISHIKLENAASIHAFKKAGFVYEKKTSIRGNAILILTLERK